MSPKLILASHNEGKLCELVAIFEEKFGELPAGTIQSAGSLALSEPKEDGATFAENALLKARAVYAETGIPAIADDSGLIVDILQGAPGILSARWSGKHGDDEANNALLLAQLSEVPANLRRAHFTSAVAYVYGDTPDKEIVTLGEMQGVIVNSANEQRGTNGFGYDSIFIPNAYANKNLTSAELTPEQKNAISHRSMAMKAMLENIVL